MFIMTKGAPESSYTANTWILQVYCRSLLHVQSRVWIKALHIVALFQNSDAFQVFTCHLGYRADYLLGNTQLEACPMKLVSASRTGNHVRGRSIPSPIW